MSHSSRAPRALQRSLRPFLPPSSLLLSAYPPIAARAASLYLTYRHTAANSAAHFTACCIQLTSILFHRLGASGPATYFEFTRQVPLLAFAHHQTHFTSHIPTYTKSYRFYFKFTLYAQVSRHPIYYVASILRPRGKKNIYI